MQQMNQRSEVNDGNTFKLAVVKPATIFSPWPSLGGSEGITLNYNAKSVLLEKLVQFHDFSPTSQQQNTMPPTCLPRFFWNC